VPEGQEPNLLHGSINSASPDGIPGSVSAFAAQAPSVAATFNLNIVNGGGTVLLVSTPVPGGMVVAP
jgi:hypothetical protein